MEHSTLEVLFVGVSRTEVFFYCHASRVPSRNSVHVVDMFAFCGTCRMLCSAQSLAGNRSGGVRLS